MIRSTYDLENNSKCQDGLLYYSNIVSPGSFVEAFSNLLPKLEDELVCPTHVQSKKYRFSRSFSYESINTRNLERVVQKTKDAL